MANTAQYKEILENAVKANNARTFFAQYPEHPKAYPEDGPKKGLEAYKSRLNKKYDELLQGEGEDWIGEEVSPFTQEPLGITYPRFSNETLVKNAKATQKDWRKAGPLNRATILIEALENLKERFFEMANATMHTTGQGWVMSFQASGPHANDRALEALAMAYQEQTRFGEDVKWVKPMGKHEVKLTKTFHPVPKGVSLTIGCSTFPVWNSVPGIFSSLATGNPVIVKPHPGSVLPSAIIVAEIQKALQNEGLDPKTIQLAVDSQQNLIAKELANHPDVKLIDYTGGNAFGDYLETLEGKTVFTEKAGVNPMIIDSAEDLDAVFQNLAFSVSLYSGQMCTAPQNFYIPEGGVKEGEQVVPFDDVVQRLKNAIHGFVNHPKMGPGTLGAVQNDRTLERARQAGSLGGKVILEPGTIENPDFPNARICTPAIVQVDADSDVKEQELFGPLILVVKTKNTDQSIEIAKRLAAEKGAITCGAYTTDKATEEKIVEEMEASFAPVSINLTGFIWVNQNAAFSDFHVTGGNPAGNASFGDPNFANRRFVWVGHKKLAG